jgi:hypothetical protein
MFGLEIQPDRPERDPAFGKNLVPDRDRAYFAFEVPAASPVF